MDFIDRLRELSSKVPKLSEQDLIKTEEGTKNALVMPFINALGYNVFDPLEVTPELTADVGTKKGEKVDYAIMRDGKPIILFECKSLYSDLNKSHASQLFRYFAVTQARFGVLTNGVMYHFYSDLDEANKMDEKPFMVFNLGDFDEVDVEALKQFTKTVFDQDKIISTASELKYRNAIKSTLAEEYQNPSEDFIRLCLRDVYTGRFTQSALQEFSTTVKDAFRSFVKEQVDKRLQTALASETTQETEEVKLEVVEDAEEETKIVTTQEEIDAYLIVKSIVREVIDAKRVFMRDTQSYCGVLVDDNNRKAICRFRFNSSTKYISILDADKNEEKFSIDTLDDIYQHGDKLKEVATRHL